MQDGFIHLTADPALLVEVANQFYTGAVGDWEVLVIDPAKLTAEVGACGIEPSLLSLPFTAYRSPLCRIKPSSRSFYDFHFLPFALPWDSNILMAHPRGE